MADRNLSLDETFQCPYSCRMLRVFLSRSGDCWRVSELAQRFQLDESEVRRYLEPLERHGLIRRDGEMSSEYHFSGDGVREIVEAAIWSYEKGLIRKNLGSVQLGAEAKIRAVDDLADHIACARRDVRA